jgi:hypothetical protein
MIRQLAGQDQATSWQPPVGEIENALVPAMAGDHS